MNLYELLGLPANATTKEIRPAYLKRVKDLHPDTAGHLSQSERDALNAQLASVIAAYEVLSDEDRRRAYDVENELMAALLDTFKAAVLDLANDAWSTGSDPFYRVRQMLGNRFHSLQRELALAHTRRDRLRVNLGRAQRRDGASDPNPFRDCLQALYERAQYDILVAQEQLNQLHRMTQMLEEYVWVVPPPAKLPRLAASMLGGAV